MEYITFEANCRNSKFQFLRESEFYYPFLVKIMLHFAKVLENSQDQEKQEKDLMLVEMFVLWQNQ